MYRSIIFAFVLILVVLGSFNTPPFLQAQEGSIQFTRRQILGGGGVPSAMQWSPDGTMLAVSSGLGITLYTPDLQVIRTLELPQYTPLAFYEPPGVGQLAWSPDGKYLAAGTGYFVPSIRSRYAGIWEVETGKLVHIFERQGDPPLFEAAREVAWSPDGKRLAGFARNQFWVWDAESGEALVTQEHTHELFENFRWSSVDNTLQIFNTLTMEFVTFNPESGEQLSATNVGDAVNITILDSPDATLSAKIDKRNNRIVILNKATNAEQYTFEISTNTLYLPIQSLWSADSRYFMVYVTTRQPQVHIWDMQSGASIFSRTFDSLSAIEGIALDPDAQYLAITTLPGIIEVYNLASGEQIGYTWSSVGNVVDLDWSPDGTQLASVSANDRLVRVWNVADGQPRFTLSGHSGWVSSVDWSPDGTQIASGDASPTMAFPSSVKIWDATIGTEIADLPIANTIEDFGFIGGLAWSPDGTKLMAVRESNATGKTFLRVWEANTQELLYTLDPARARLTPVVWSPDNNTLMGAVIALGGIALVFDDGTQTDTALMTFDVGAQTLIQEIATTEFTVHLGWQPNGTLVANAESGDINRLSLWDGYTGELKLTAEYIEPRISALAWSPDGKYVAMGTFRATTEPMILIYEVRADEVVLTTTLEGYLSFATGITALAWSDDGTMLASAGDDGQIILWDVE